MNFWRHTLSTFLAGLVLLLIVWVYVSYKTDKLWYGYETPLDAVNHQLNREWKQK